MSIPVADPAHNDRSSKLALSPRIILKRVELRRPLIERDSYASGEQRRFWYLTNQVMADLGKRAVSKSALQQTGKSGKKRVTQRRKISRVVSVLAALFSPVALVQVVRAVVTGVNPDPTRSPIQIEVVKGWKKNPLPEWDDLSLPERWAFGVVYYLQASKGTYSTVNLNLSESKSKRPLENLKEIARKKLPEIFGLSVPFCFEYDEKGRAHMHSFVPGDVTDKQRKQLKSFGGKWDGSNPKHQLVIKHCTGIQGAIQWASGYMLKEVVKGNAVCYTPRIMAQSGRAHYEHVAAIVRDLCVQARNQSTSLSNKTKVLEKTSGNESLGEKIDTAILKSRSYQNNRLQTLSDALEGHRDTLGGPTYRISEMTFNHESRCLHPVSEVDRG